MPAEDAATTYQHFGYTVPRINIVSKFGSYWGTILGLATGPASAAATSVLAAAFTGWNSAILASGATACFFVSGRHILEPPTPAAKIKDRQPVCSLLSAHSRQLCMRARCMSILIMCSRPCKHSDAKQLAGSRTVLTV